MKIYFEYIFIVLVYRNTTDLQDFISSANKKVNNSKIVVINSFFDQLTSNEFRKISLSNNCDFIEIENKGYSYGNNQGVAYAKRTYDFDYIIISNADITIENFIKIENKQHAIVAPEIRNKINKRQNPMIIKDFRIAENIKYYGMRANNKCLLYLGIALAKILSLIIFTVNKTCLSRDSFKIYQAHGSFIIIGNKALDIIGEIFDDHMFLFAEESLLALKCKKRNIDIIYDESIRVFHKEDGSMQFCKNSIFENSRKSYIYFYENYYKK